MKNSSSVGDGWTRAELVVLAAVIAVGAAILWPAVMRAADTANEAQAIADTRTVMSAEETYAAANGGFYSAPVNLCRNGGDCAGIGIPNYPYEGPGSDEFIDGPTLGRTSPYTSDGYVHTFTNGVAPSQVYYWLDTRSVVSYCYDTMPETVDGNRSFSGDGTGHMWQDELGARIGCPGTEPLDLEAGQELVVDFGTRGLWLYDGLSNWTQLAGWDPVLVREWGGEVREIAVSFGPGKGLWSYKGSGWTQLTNWEPYDFVESSEALLVAFDSGRGLWRYDDAWTQLTSEEPSQMVLYGNKVALDFGQTHGLWLHWDVVNGIPQVIYDLDADVWVQVSGDNGLQQLTTWDPSLLFDFGGELVMAFDGGRGVWGTSYERWSFVFQEPYVPDWQQRSGWGHKPSLACGRPAAWSWRRTTDPDEASGCPTPN